MCYRVPGNRRYQRTVWVERRQHVQVHNWPRVESKCRLCGPINMFCRRIPTDLSSALKKVITLRKLSCFNRRKHGISFSLQQPDVIRNRGFRIVGTVICQMLKGNFQFQYALHCIIRSSKRFRSLLQKLPSLNRPVLQLP